MIKDLGYIFNIGLLSSNDGTDPMDKFVPNVVYDKHLIFTFFDLSFEISLDIRVVVDCGQGTHMEVFFERSVGHWMYSGLTEYRSPRGVFKRYYTTITGKLFGIVVLGKEVGEDGHMQCRDLAYPRYGSNQSNGFIEPVIGENKFLYFAFDTLNFITKVLVDLFEVLFGELAKFRGKQFQFIWIFIYIRSGINQFSSDFQQYFDLFKHFWKRLVKFEFFVVFRSIFRNPFSIDFVILPPVNTYTASDLDGHFHTKMSLFFHKFGDDKLSVHTGMFHTYQRVFQRDFLIFKKSDKSIAPFLCVFKYIRGSPIIFNNSGIKELFRYVNTDKVTKSFVCP